MDDHKRLDELRRRVEKDPASIAFASLAEELRKTGEHDEAVRVCRAGLEHHPTYLSARVTLGRALLELQQYPDARTEFEYVLHAAPDNLLALKCMNELQQRDGNASAAAPDLGVLSPPNGDGATAAAVAELAPVSRLSFAARAAPPQPDPEPVAPPAPPEPDPEPAAPPAPDPGASAVIASEPAPANPLSFVAPSAPPQPDPEPAAPPPDVGALAATAAEPTPVSPVSFAAPSAPPEPDPEPAPPPDPALRELERWHARIREERARRTDGGA